MNKAAAAGIGAVIVVVVVVGAVVGLDFAGHPVPLDDVVKRLRTFGSKPEQGVGPHFPGGSCPICTSADLPLVVSQIALDGAAPLAAAPALWFEDGPLTVQVDPHGEHEVWHSETGHAGPPVRRVYHPGQEGGLFGPGWRAECESRVARTANGLTLVGYAGTLHYRQAGAGVWVSTAGPVSTVLETPDGFRTRDEAGRTCTYDTEGQLVAIAPGFRVDRTFAELRLIDEAGNTTTLTVTNGRVTHANSGNRRWRYRYEVRLVGVESGHKRAYAYDEDGRVVHVESDAQLPVDLAYDPAGRPVELISGDWTQRYTYSEAEGEEPAATRVENPAGRWEYHHTPLHWLVETPDAVEEAFFDTRGQRVATRVNGGRLRAVPHQAAPHATETARPQAPHSERTRNVDALGAQGHATDLDTQGAQGHATDLDAQGAQEHATDLDAPRAQGHATDLDAQGAQGRATDLDAQGAQGRATDLDVRGAQGRVRTRYDMHGRPSVIETDEGSLVFDYDPEHRVVSCWRSGSGERQVGFDPAGRLTGAEGAGLPVRQSFHPDGTLASRTVGKHTLRWSTHEGVLRTETPWGSVRREHDAQGRERSVEVGGRRFRFDYDDAGNLSATHYPNGVIAQWEHDPAGRVTRLTSAGLCLSFRFGATGQLERTTRDGQRSRWGHGADGRLVEGHGPWGERAYGHDARGARSWIARNGVRETSAHDAHGRLLRVGERRAEHDPCGRLLALEPDRYRYDAWGRVSQVQRSGIRVGYGYDATGQLAWREVDGVRTELVHARGKLLAEVSPAGARLYVHAQGSAAPLAYVEGDRWTYLLADPLGTVLAYLNDRGAVVARATYDPFGELLAGPVDRPLVFAGRTVDAAGLVSHGSRVYVPELGRFTTPASGSAGPYESAHDPLTAAGPAAARIDWLPAESRVRVPCSASRAERTVHALRGKGLLRCALFPRLRLDPTVAHPPFGAEVFGELARESLRCATYSD